MPVKLESRIPEIAASIPLRVGAVITESMEGIAREASNRAPVAAETLHFKGGDVAPGYLKDSIEARSGSRRGSRFGDKSELGKAGMLGDFAGATEVYGIYAAWYWYLPEYGTRFAAAQPFMIPAAETGMPAMVTAIKVALNEL